MSQHRSPEASTDAPTPSLSPTFSSQPDPEPSSPLFSPVPTPDPSTWGLPPQSPLSSETDPSDESSPELGDGFGSPPPSIARGWKQRAEQLLPTTRAGVETAGGVLHSFLTVEDSPEQLHGLYLPDEDDVDAIAVPLAGLASRRVPAEAANPDVTDLIGLAFGVVGYVMKQLRKRAHLRATFAGGIDHEPDQDEQE
jgi:hypothetical protein